MNFFKNTSLGALLLLLTFSSNAQLNGKTKRKLKANHLEFYMPEGYAIAPTVEHPNLANDFSIAKEDEDFQIRYKVSPLKNELKTYKKLIKNPTKVVVHPNSIWKSAINGRVNLLCNKEEKIPDVRYFEDEAFNEDFIGDAGGLCFFEVSESSEIGYKYAITMVIHRNFIADVHITFLGNEKEKLQDNSLTVFHAMKFFK